MTIHPTPSLKAFTPAALAASHVGTWEYDVVADRIRLDAAMAPLYGLSANEGEQGVPLARYREAIHPEDLPRHTARAEEVFRRGGLFVIEYRTRPPLGPERWILLRGFYEADARGRVLIGRGIAIDVTEGKRDGYADGQAHFLTVDPAADVPSLLDRMAELTLDVRRIVDRIGGRTRAILRPLVDALLFGIGRQLAARLGSLPDEDEPEGISERRH